MTRKTIRKVRGRSRRIFGGRIRWGRSAIELSMPLWKTYHDFHLLILRAAAEALRVPSQYFGVLPIRGEPWEFSFGNELDAKRFANGRVIVLDGVRSVQVGPHARRKRKGLVVKVWADMSGYQK